MTVWFLFQKIKEFRDDELHHHDIGLENDAEKVTTVVPTKSDSDVILCLHLLSETLTCTLHLSLR